VGKDQNQPKSERGRPRWVGPKSIANQLTISERHAERLCQEGVFGPRLVIGHRTVRVQQAGVDAFLAKAEGPK